MGTKRRLGARFLFVSLAISIVAPSLPAEAIGVMTIQGNIRDPIGRPIQGAAVADGSQTVYSDANGHYMLEEQRISNYLSAVSKLGFESTSRLVTPLEALNPIDFTLKYVLLAPQTNPQAFNNNPPKTLQITVKSYAPTNSCVSWADQATGTNLALSLTTAVPGGQSTWSGSFAVPAGTVDGTYTHSAVARDCPSGTDLTRVISGTYVVDSVAPVISRLAPEDHGNTMFGVQRIMAIATDKSGSGVDVTTSVITLRDETSAGPVTTFAGLTNTYDSASGWLKSPANSLSAGDTYRATLQVKDRAGNASAFREWRFRAVTPPTIDQGALAAGSLFAEGINTGQPGSLPGMTRWEFNPSLTVLPRYVHFSRGSAHPGWGLIATTVPVGNARIEVDGVTWLTRPYASNDTRTFYQEVDYFDSLGRSLDVYLTSLDLRLPKITVDLPATASTAVMKLDGASTSAEPAGVCADPQLGPAGCGPDPLPFFASDSFAERLRDEVLELKDNLLTQPVQTVTGILKLLTDVRNPANPEGVWHQVSPVSQVTACSGAPPPANVCWYGSPAVGYQSSSMPLFPTDYADLCASTRFCSYTTANSDFDETSQCIDPNNGTDYDLNPTPEPGTDPDTPCQQLIVLYISIPWRAPLGQPHDTVQFHSSVHFEWGVQDGDYDELGLWWSAKWKKPDGKLRDIVWAPAPTFDGDRLSVNYFIDGGIYPRSPSNPNPAPSGCQLDANLPVHFEVGDNTGEPGTCNGCGPFGVGSGGNDKGTRHGWPQWKAYGCTGGAYYGRATSAGVWMMAKQVDYSTAGSTHYDGYLQATYGHVYYNITSSYAFDLIDVAAGCAAGAVGCAFGLLWQFDPERHDEQWTKAEARKNGFSYPTNF